MRDEQMKALSDRLAAIQAKTPVYLARLAAMRQEREAEGGQMSEADRLMERIARTLTADREAMDALMSQVIIAQSVDNVDEFYRYEDARNALTLAYNAVNEYLAHLPEARRLPETTDDSE